MLNAGQSVEKEERVSHSREEVMLYEGQRANVLSQLVVKGLEDYQNLSGYN